MQQQIIKAPWNLKINFSAQGVDLTYVLTTTQPAGLYTSSSGFVYDVKTIPYYDKKTGNRIPRNYAYYRITVFYQENLPEKVMLAYLKFKKVAMIDAREYKLSICKGPKAIKKLNEELEFLRDLKDGEWFGGYMMTEKYKQEKNLLIDEFIPTTI